MKNVLVTMWLEKEVLIYVLVTKGLGDKVLLSPVGTKGGSKKIAPAVSVCTGEV